MVRIIISIILIMVPTIFFGYLGKPTLMTISLFAGFTSAVILNYDKFESFKAGHLEAKLKKANEVIEEAHATIDQLKSVTDPLLKSNLILLLHDGSFDGMGIDDKESTFKELLKVNEVLKLETVEPYIKKAAKGVANRHFYELYRIAEDSTFREKFEKYTTIHFAPETPSVSEIQQYFSNHPDTMTRDIKEKLDRFKEFKQTYLE